MKLSKKVAEKVHHVLLFGPPKSGKTELAGKTAEAFDIIYVDIENGITTLTKLPIEWQDRVEVISLPDTRSNPVGIETCLKLAKGDPGSVCETHGKWNCMVCKKDNLPVIEVHLNALPITTIVIFDSLTQLTNSGMAQIGKNRPDDYKFEFDDWANLGRLMDTFLSYIQQAKYNVICISHETEVEMQDGKNKLVPTAGTRNFSRNTAKYFDEVIYCEVKNKQHVAGSSTTYSNNILTGSRTNQVLESTPGSASLIPLFKGEVKAHNPVTVNAPANIAVSSLKDKLAAMKGGK